MANPRWFKNRSRRQRRFPRAFARGVIAGVPYGVSAGKKVLALGRTVAGLYRQINAEKFHLDSTSGTDPDTSGSVVHLTAIAQGDGQSDRTGNSLRSASLYMRATWEVHASATSTLVRILVVKDNQQIGDTTPSIANVLDAVSMTSPLNSATVGRFSILLDRVIRLSHDSSNQSVFLKRYWRLGHHIRYNGSASTDIQKGGLYVMTFSNEPSSVPAQDINFRFTYHDN